MKNELMEIKDKYSFEAFLKKHECDATAEDIASFAKEMKEGEIGDDEAAAVAGGSFMDKLMGFLESYARAIYEAEIRIKYVWHYATAGHRYGRLLHVIQVILL